MVSVNTVAPAATDVLPEKVAGRVAGDGTDEVADDGDDVVVEFRAVFEPGLEVGVAVRFEEVTSVSRPIRFSAFS